METHRHRRRRLRPAHSARLVLALFKGAALGALLTLVVAGGLHATAPSARPGVTAASDSYQRALERAVAAHHCSYAGLGRNPAPASALVRTMDGRLRQVSFEVAWDVYNGNRPGTLVAVCLDEPEPTGLVEVGS